MADPLADGVTLLFVGDRTLLLCDGGAVLLGHLLALLTVDGRAHLE